MEKPARLGIYLGSQGTLFAWANLWPDVMRPGSWVVIGFLVGSVLMLLDRLIPYAKASVDERKADLNKWLDGIIAERFGEPHPSDGGTRE